LYREADNESKPFQPTNLELNLQKELRQRIEQVIFERHLSSEDLAKELDLLPSGAQALMEKKEDWTIETALRIAEGLKISMSLIVRP
jgi:hypothetical protein